MTESALLEKFIRDHDEEAFTTLVRQHLDFVYGAALRQSHGDAQRAEDVTQEVFLQLARKAPSLARHPCLVGWLHTATRFAALAAQRQDRRRLQREKTLEAMNELTPASIPQWENVRPVIDDALQVLDEIDRRSVLLRFFANQDFKQIGEQLGASENAAQKRVARALEQLSAALTRRGVPSTAAALTLALAESGVAAPPALIGTIAPAAIAAATTGTFTASSLILAGKILLGISAATAAGFAAGVWYDTGTADKHLDQERQEFAARLSEAESRVHQASDRADLAEADTARLLAAIELAKSERESAAAAATAAALEAKRKAGLVPPPPPTADYVLTRGDTGQKIAEKLGLTAEQLQALNPEVEWARLKVGQKLRVPPGTVARP